MRRVWIALAGAAIMVGLPLAALADNQQIAEQIAAQLRNSGQLHGYKIGVKFQDGTAWLRGRVSSEEQMRLALQLASQVPGVQRVENELTVVLPETKPTPTAGNVGKLLNPFGSSGVTPASADLPAPVLQQSSSAMGPEKSPRPIGLSNFGLTRSEGVRRVSGVETGPMLAGPEQLSSPSPYYGAVPAMMMGSEETPAPTGSLRPIPEQPAQPISAASRTASRQQPILRPIPVAMAPAGASPSTPVPTQPVAGSPAPVSGGPVSGALAPVRYDQPHLPNYAWPSYAAYPNYAAVTYPKQYSPTAWPYIGPFYPYPQVPLGWRKVSLEWHDGWWFMDFDDGAAAKPFNGLFRLK